MSIELALPAPFDVSGLAEEADPLEDRLSREAFLDSPIDEFGEAASIRALYQDDAEEPED